MIEKAQNAGELDLHTSTTTDKYTQDEYINVAINQEEELFTSKMFELYGKYQDQLEAIIKNREIYEKSTDSAYTPYIEVLKIYDLYTKINGKDPEVSEALRATCYWYIFKNISGDGEDSTQFMDEQDPDEKGNKKAPKLNLNRLSEYLIKKYCIVSFKDMCYIFLNNQYYESKDRVEKDIVNILLEIGFSDHAKIKDTVKDILYRVIKMTTKFKEFPFNKRAKMYIPVLNGVIVLKNLNLLMPQSPAWGFTYSSPVKYDPNADSSKIKEFLESIVSGDEEYEILLQIPAQAFLQDENYQQAYLSVGSGSNGKSTYINLTSELVGKQNICAVSLQEIIENRFAAAELNGKLIDFYADLPSTSLKATGKFKILTGGDTVTVEKKFAQPFQMVNKAVLCFSANQLPSVDDASYSFWRRWCIIEFPFQFKVDPLFMKKLITPENLSGYLNLIIEKINKIQTYGLTRSSKVENAMNMWKRSSDSTFAYIEDMLERSPKDYIKRDTLYNLYLNYCDDMDLMAATPTKFSHSVIKFGAVETKTTENSVRVKIFKGVKIKEKNTPELIIHDNESVPTIF